MWHVHPSLEQTTYYVGVDPPGNHHDNPCTRLPQSVVDASI